MNNYKIQNVSYNIIKIYSKIKKIADNYNRIAKEIKIIAVSKNKSINLIKSAIDAGQLAFGENYVQEAVKKIIYFKELQIPNLEWHFIGTLQTNKSKKVAEYFDWCHTINSSRIANRLNKQRPTSKKPLNVLIQININNESNKFGAKSIEVNNLSSYIIKELPCLKLRGIMAILDIEKNYEHQFFTAKRIYSIFENLKNIYPTIDTLSLGMSSDMELAIAAGSNMLRIGTAIFGDRY